MAGYGSEQYSNVSTFCLMIAVAVRADPVARRVADAGVISADRVGEMMQDDVDCTWQLVSSSRCCGEM